MTNRGLFITLTLIILLFPLASASSLFAQAPTIIIDYPFNGITTERLIKVKGSIITQSAIQECVMVANGIERTLAVNSNRFESTILAAPGNNNVHISATNVNGEVGLANVSFFAQVPKRDIKIVLTWSTNATDVDLWVTNPSGESCYFENLTTELGDRLDVDDVDGYGPETYTLNNAVSGTYQVHVHYYNPNNVPITEIKVWVVLYEGTAREEKNLYEGILVQKGDLINIVNLNIQEFVEQ